MQYDINCSSDLSSNIILEKQGFYGKTIVRCIVFRLVLLFGFLAILFMLMIANTDHVNAKIKSGKWHNMKWSYNTETRVLIIKGNGRMRYRGDLADTAGWYYPAREAKKLILKGNIKNVGKMCFENYQQLREVIIPKSITEISEDAFFQACRLKKIEFHDGIKKIDQGAFAVSGLENITIPSSVKSIGRGAFSSSTRLKNIKIKNGIRVLWKSSFSGIHSLKSVSLPNSLKSIKENALGDAGVKRVSLPQNVEEIGNYSLARMENLKKVVIKSKRVKKWGRKIFYKYKPHKIIVEVPKSKYNEYKPIILKNSGNKKVVVVKSEKY